MTQIPIGNDDNCSVAGSDFILLDQPDQMPDQEAQQQPRFGLQQKPLDWKMDTGTSTRSYGIDLKEYNLMMSNLEAKHQMLQAKVEKVELLAQGSLSNLQGKVENLELKAENRALKENVEQKANYQALETKFAKMLSIQNEEHQKQMEQLKDEFSKMLAEQQKQMMAQFETENNSLEKKLKEAEERAQIENKGHLLTKGKILANRKGNGWNRSKSEASISACELKASSYGLIGEWVIATDGYAISGEQCRKYNLQFPGRIVFYFEVTFTTSYWFSAFSVGFTDGSKPADRPVSRSPNSYGIIVDYAKIGGCWLSGKEYKLEYPILPIGKGGVVGCGLLLNSKNELAVFFTLDANLLGKPIPINPTVDRLYPTVYTYFTVKANFGDNLAVKPFKFDIDECPGLVF